MEIQSNHNVSQGNIYAHTYKESPMHTAHTESYPAVRLERGEGLSVYVQIPRSASTMTLVNQTCLHEWTCSSDQPVTLPSNTEWKIFA